MTPAEASHWRTLGTIICIFPVLPRPDAAAAPVFPCGRATAACSGWKTRKTLMRWRSPGKDTGGLGRGKEGGWRYWGNGRFPLHRHPGGHCEVQSHPLQEPLRVSQPGRALQLNLGPACSCRSSAWQPAVLRGPTGAGCTKGSLRGHAISRHLPPS